LITTHNGDDTFEDHLQPVTFFIFVFHFIINCFRISVTGRACDNFFRVLSLKSVTAAEITTACSALSDSVGRLQF